MKGMCIPLGNKESITKQNDRWPNEGRELQTVYSHLVFNHPSINSILTLRSTREHCIRNDWAKDHYKTLTFNVHVFD